MSRSRRSEITLTDRLGLAMVRALRLTIGTLPPGGAVNLGAALGAMAHGVFPLRRGVVRSNLAIAFGASHTVDERRRIESAAYRGLGMMAAEWLGLWRNGLAWLEKQIQEIEGEHHIEALEKAGSRFLVLTGHFGNWEMLGAFYGFRRNLSVVAKPLHNRLLDQELSGVRRRYGMEILSTDSPAIASEIIQAVRGGRIVCFLGDQDARRTGVFAPFFGRPASTFSGPAMFAIRLGIPILPSFLLRLGPGRHRVIIRPPIEPPRELPLREAIVRMTGEHVRVLEDVVRLAPSQYFWFHRRWKTQPPRQSPEAKQFTDSPPGKDSPEGI
jgi:KDO2-lipid IV(A) lauroyltransferase